MIKAKDAYQNVINPELNTPEEIHYYKLLIGFIDYCIKEFFDGEKVIIDLDNRIFTSNEPLEKQNEYVFVPYGKYQNYITGIGKIKYWRKSIVFNKWMNDYIEAGWEIDEKGDEKYQFKYNRRDDRLTDILK